METNKISLARGAAIGLFLFLIFGLWGCTDNSQELGQRPVAQVNSTTLTATEFGTQLAARLKNYDALFAKQDANVSRIKNEIISEFVNSVIMRDYAQKNGLPAPDEEVEAQVQKVRGSYPDDISFRDALAQEGLSLEKWKTSVRQSVYERIIFKKVASGIKEPTEEEISTFYKNNKQIFVLPARVRLRQIVVEKEEDAKRVLARLRQGGSTIEKLAKEFSVAPEGSVGGDTGWIEKGALEVFDLAFKMNIGARSSVVKSSYGFHIFEVLGKKNPSQLSLPEARSKIAPSLRAEKERLSFQTWLADQIKTANIKKDEQLISSVQVHTEH